MSRKVKAGLLTFITFLVIFYGGAAINFYIEFKYPRLDYFLPFCFGYIYAVCEYFITRKIR